jgi:F-type H+-transporting ATPase subunit b
LAAASPDILEVPDAGPAAPGTIADAEYAAHHEALFGLDSYAIVGLAFVAFVLVLWKAGAFRFITGALDSEAGKVRAELDEATRLRAEAEAMKAAAAAEAAELEAQAKATLVNAQAEAKRIVEHAVTDAEQAIARQKKIAEDRIAATAQGAEAELRGRAADLALNATVLLLRDRAGNLDELTDQAIAALDPR